ncbi:MAG: hypothetical protein AAF555_12155 [Verrucomicrobiota bacterium]
MQVLLDVWLVISDWMDFIPEWMAQGVVTLLVVPLSLFLWSWWRAKRGLRTDEIVAQYNLLAKKPDGTEVLLLRSINVPGYGEVEGLLGNQVVARKVKRQAEKKTWPDPLIRLRGREGNTARATLFGKVMGANFDPRGPKEMFLGFLTCESIPKAAKIDRKIRLMLIRAADLRRFLDSDWAKSLHTERPSHFWRVVALQRLAMEVFVEKGERWREEFEMTPPVAASREETFPVAENWKKVGPWMVGET